MVGKSLLKWGLQTRLSTVLLGAQALTALCTLLAYCSPYRYAAIPRKDLPNVLLYAVSPKLRTVPHLPACQYDHIINSNDTFYNKALPLDSKDFLPTGIEGGAYAPAHCNARFSVAVLVTYRNRQRQLDTFLPYIHNFLREQDIHYKIFLIEQQDPGAWNKGVLYNVGARAAAAEGWPCLVLHDVDLLPLDAANLYACTRDPRHLSAAIDKFRYVLPYTDLIGGVAALSAEQFARVNGFSNRYTGWGGEDDDLAARLRAHRLPILRLEVEMSRYAMLVHRRERPNPRLAATLRAAVAAGAAAAAADGLASAPRHYRALSTTSHRLFTLIAVTL